MLKISKNKRMQDGLACQEKKKTKTFVTNIHSVLNRILTHFLSDTTGVIKLRYIRSQDHTVVLQQQRAEGCKDHVTEQGKKTQLLYTQKCGIKFGQE